MDAKDIQQSLNNYTQQQRYFDQMFRYYVEQDNPEYPWENQ